MEISSPETPARRFSPETPSFLKSIENQVDGFDIIKEQQGLADLPKTGGSNLETEAAADLNRMRAVSISMPSSPASAHSHSRHRLPIKDLNEPKSCNDTPKSTTMPSSSGTSPQTQSNSYSQPFPTIKKDPPVRNPAIDRLKEGRFNSFKTWSGKLERQVSNLRGGRNRETPRASTTQQSKELENLPVHRYFDALQGPELDTLRPSEETLLPKDEQWPFLLRYPVSSFGICLGVSSQAIMWKALAVSASTKFLNVSLHVNLVLWCISLALVAFVSSIYILKMILYFEAVRREYYHPIRVNFFFAPFIALLFLALGAPPRFSKYLHQALWYILMTPIFCLELKIYGQWMSGGQRRLSKVANPSNHLSVVGNFVGALLGATMGLKEGPLCFFAIGVAHYTVLFVTLYQRLPTNETLPKELHPVFFLFVAAPSVASMAWANIQGSFDNGSKIAYFIALFLYFSLAVRINFFRGFRFSLAWWAYTFPMTGAAIATIKYSIAVTTIFTKCLAVALCAVSTLTVTALFITTLVHALVLRDLFPNDIAIAISDRKPKPTRRWHLIGAGTSDTREIEHYLKFVNPEEDDLEAATTEQSNSTVGARRLSRLNDARLSQH